MECTTTERMPSSRQVRTTRSAISPRLAIRIVLNMAVRHAASPEPSHDQRFAVLDRLCRSPTRISHDPAGLVGLDRVHQLHGLDDPDLLAGRHHVADLDERRVVRARRAVERAHQRRLMWDRSVSGWAGGRRLDGRRGRLRLGDASPPWSGSGRRRGAPDRSGRRSHHSSSTADVAAIRSRSRDGRRPDSLAARSDPAAVTASSTSLHVVGPFVAGCPAPLAAHARLPCSSPSRRTAGTAPSARPTRSLRGQSRELVAGTPTSAAQRLCGGRR